MRLTDFRWLIIWAFLGGIILNLFAVQREEIVCGKKEYRWSWWAAIFLVLPYIIWAGNRDTSGAFGDSLAYYGMYRRVPTGWGEFLTYLDTITKDKGYTVFMYLIKVIIGFRPYLYFTILASIQMLLIVSVCRKYSCNYWLSIFIFIASTDYMSWVHNGVRQFLAVTIIFGATDLWVRKKYIPLIAIILLASTIHASAIIMIPVIFIVQGKPWNIRTILLLILTILAVIYIDRFTDILNDALVDTQYMGSVEEWKAIGDDGTNPVRVLVYSVPAILSLIGYKWIIEENNPVINLSVGCAICTSLIYVISIFTSGIIIGRVPIYVSLYGACILLPWELEHIFSANSALIVKGMAIAFYCAFFYYQMHLTWGII